MGPRSDERGNHDISKGIRLPAKVASMGPRSDERGNEKPLGSKPAGICGFNGAALR